MNQSRRDLLKALCLFPFVGKIPTPVAPARRIVGEVIEHTFIGSIPSTPIVFNVAGMPLPIVHTDFTFAFRELEGSLSG